MRNQKRRRTVAMAACVALLVVLATAIAAAAAADPFTWTPYFTSIASAGNVGNVNAVACPSQTQCTMVTSLGFEETFDPLNPLAQGTPVRMDGEALLDVACPSATQCTAVDNGRASEVTFNPQSPNLNTGVLNFNWVGDFVAVACPSVTQCTVTPSASPTPGNDSAVLTFNPQSPDLNAQPVTLGQSGGSELNGISCPSTTVCGAVSVSDEGDTFNPQDANPQASVHEPTVPSGTATPSPSAIACPTATQCTIANHDGSEFTFAPTDAPHSSGPLQVVDAGKSLSSMACPSAIQCTAVDSGGGEVTFSPQSATPNSTVVAVAGVSQPVVVACGTVNVCVASDLLADASTGRNQAAFSSPTLGLTAPASSAIGTAVSASAALSGGSSPGAAITFTVFGPQATAPTDCSSGGTTVGTASVSGNGTYHPSPAFTPNAFGKYWWYASYSGDDNNNPSSSVCGAAMPATTVTQASPSLSLTAPTSDTVDVPIAPSNLSATLSGGSSASGTVTFRVFGPQGTAPTNCSSGGTTVGTASVSGNATYHPLSGFTPNTAGTYWWYASYGGDANNKPSASACGATMAKTIVSPASTATLSVSAPSSGVVGSAVPASGTSATLSGGIGTPAGSINFWVVGPQATVPTAGQCSGSAESVGVVSVSGNGTYHPGVGFSPTAVGRYWWFATYSGDTNNAALSSACGAAMPQTVVAGAPTALSLTAPSAGTVDRAIAASDVSAALSNGLSEGGTVSFTVFGPQSAPPTDCSASGTGATTVGTASVSGDGTYSPSAGFTPTSAGDYWWYASYGGDANNAPSASACGAAMRETTVTTMPTSLSLTAAPSSGTAGTAISATAVSAALSGGSSPGGRITVRVFGPQASAPTSCTSGGTPVGTADVSSNGAYHPSADFTPPAAGKYWWYASYSGDHSNGGSASACGASMLATIVAPASTSLALTAPSSGTAGTAISASDVSAALSGGSAPGGTVTFRVFGPQATAPTDCSSGGTTVGTASVSGNGSYNPSTGFTPGTAGDYWWYVSYGGDSNNNPSSSSCGASMAETVVGSAPGGTGGGGSGGGGPGGGTGGGPGGGTGGGPSGGSGSSGSAHLGAASVSGTTVTVPVSCSSAGPCAVTLTLSVTEKIRNGKVIAVIASNKSRRRVVVIARASVQIAAGGHARVRLRLNRKGRALLKHHSPLHALLRLSAGGKTVASEHVTIRRPRHRRG